VQFEIIGRAPFDSEGYEAAQDAGGNPDILDFVDPAQEIIGPEPGEKGRKDTLIVYPGEFAMVKATFDLAGLYVWHCHILEHEDNEMMRPYEVVAP
jgi:FtsP/CotA-like multicopper oxidase with cupredoxin domain